MPVIRCGDQWLRVIFAGALISDRERKSIKLIWKVKIISRIHSEKSIWTWSAQLIGASLQMRLGWKDFGRTGLRVVAEDERNSDRLRLITERSRQLLLCKGCNVQPDWQSKGVGTLLDERDDPVADRNAPHNAYIGYSQVKTCAFYRQFDFAPGFGMVKRIGSQWIK